MKSLGTGSVVIKTLFIEEKQLCSWAKRSLDEVGPLEQKRFKTSLNLFFVGVPGAGGQASHLIDVEEGGAGGDGALQSQRRTQMLLEEEQSIEQLQERERAIRQLEVGHTLANVSTINSILLLLCLFKPVWEPGSLAKVC